MFQRAYGADPAAVLVKMKDIEYPVKPRTLDDFPFQVPSLLGPSYRGILDERPPGNDWLFMTPK